jgi:hypothetical protein
MRRQSHQRPTFLILAHILHRSHYRLVTMAFQPGNSYEPYRHVGDDDSEHAEKLLAPGPAERSYDAGNGPLHTVNKPRTAPHAHVRTVLRSLALLVAVSVLGIQAYTAFVWLDTKHDTYYNPATRLQTRSWASLNISPTYLMLGVGAFATLVHLLALTSLCSCVSGSDWFFGGWKRMLIVDASTVSRMA